jgi:hypothetical protein
MRTKLKTREPIERHQHIEQTRIARSKARGDGSRNKGRVEEPGTL